MIKLYDNPSAMEPLFPTDDKGILNELAITLFKKSVALSNSLHPITRNAVSKLVQPMNSYYSNLIEGHNTHPLEIEKAMRNTYSDEPKKRILQLESIAHIEVEIAMKKKLKEEAGNICSFDFIGWIHREFYMKMPDEFRFIKNKDGKTIEVIPGALRTTEVEVGHHIGPAAASLENFLDKFAGSYNPDKITNHIKRIIAAAASHHRLAWIHPFADGNGRVVRLFTEAFFILENIDGNGLWSISRGLAKFNKKYYSTLHNADQKRWDDYDGRGNLSNKALVEFCKFFLETAIDQVDFMEELLDIDNALSRINNYVDIMVSREKLRPEAKYVLHETFLKGKVAKGEMERITGKSENTARKIMKQLLEKELLTSKDIKDPVSINFPLHAAPYLFPRLYPKDIESTLDVE